MSHELQQARPVVRKTFTTAEIEQFVKENGEKLLQGYMLARGNFDFGEVAEISIIKEGYTLNYAFILCNFNCTWRVVGTYDSGRRFTTYMINIGIKDVEIPHKDKWLCLAAKALWLLINDQFQPYEHHPDSLIYTLRALVEDDRPHQVAITLANQFIKPLAYHFDGFDNEKIYRSLIESVAQIVAKDFGLEKAREMMKAASDVIEMRSSIRLEQQA